MKQLSERVRVVLAPNPSPMTLEGTNTYVVGDRHVLVIDPGPAKDGHLEAVRDAVGDASVTAILLTHKHHDHAEDAALFAETFDAQVVGFSRPAQVLVDDGARVGGHDQFLYAIHTPGHAADHLCFVLESEKVLFSGDHVLGRGTTVIAWPDGDLRAYMASLERLRHVDIERIFPGHGPVVENPMPVIEEYIAHRKMRERQILDALNDRPGTPAELVRRIYTDVDPVLYPVAEMSVRAHLDKLAWEGSARAEGERWQLTQD
ncbi:MAG: MBL fold metallo-hydrolase [Actinomycetota bacterium]|nr:MBL fold metallo-hydrolase [Actinomycetota bacterium]